MIEFDCEGCGLHVYAFGIDTVPKHHFCAACAWLCEFVPDPEEMEQIRRHGGGVFGVFGVRDEPPSPGRR